MAENPLKAPESDHTRFRIEVAERQLAALQTFFPRIDGKVTTLFGVASAQFVVLLLNLDLDALKLWYVATLAALYIIFYVYSLINLYLCNHPHLAAGSRALSYFGHVAQMGENEFIVEYTNLTDDQLLNDLTRQIWRNSQIVSKKFRYLNDASLTVLLSTVPWLLLIVLKILSDGALPQFS